MDDLKIGEIKKTHERGGEEGPKQKGVGHNNNGGKIDLWEKVHIQKGIYNYLKVKAQKTAMKGGDKRPGKGVSFWPCPQ